MDTEHGATEMPETTTTPTAAKPSIALPHFDAVIEELIARDCPEETEPPREVRGRRVVMRVEVR